jgi:hypothetical protein
MDIIATKCAVEYARKWTVDDNKGPLLLEFSYISLWRALVHFPFYFISWFNYVITRMSNPGTT